jgi:cardiolipin synthase
MALAAAQLRGADVRVILEKSDYDMELTASNSATATFLAANNVQVRSDRLDVITHAKLVVADDSVFVGSSNWNARSLQVNNEANASVTNQDVTDAFSRYFEKVWEESAKH